MHVGVFSNHLLNTLAWRKEQSSTMSIVYLDILTIPKLLTCHQMFLFLCLCLCALASVSWELERKAKKKKKTNPNYFSMNYKDLICTDIYMHHIHKNMLLSFWSDQFITKSHNTFVTSMVWNNSWENMVAIFFRQLIEFT